ncbi:hypothetical protein [Nocardia gipuzkoensis]|uniref:hypothetical protein n=1 Tax=Nocardia gipuzkoensis TaxID=2749991 RepID=UPI00237E7E95|nr:hypothetical protein [Nocardia gipuzkoensis]MDE1675258.1 hypothetical protein [Nocardia gipuzkoensis]
MFKPYAGVSTGSCSSGGGEITVDTVIRMGETGFDDLEFARQQLHPAAEELDGSEMTP